MPFSDARFCCPLTRNRQARSRFIRGLLPPPQTHVEKFTVTGTVIDAVTGEPIRKAVVQINGPQQRTTFSDGDGRFQFEAVPAGSISLSAQKPGYFGEQELRNSVVRQVEVGPKSDSVVLKLTPEGVIAGKVTTTDGAPLEHVPLTLTYLNVREGRRHWEPKGNSSTTEDGRFRFANLRPGTYYIAAGPLTPQMDSVFETPQEAEDRLSGRVLPGSSGPGLSVSHRLERRTADAEANFSLRRSARVQNLRNHQRLRGQPGRRTSVVRPVRKPASPLGAVQSGQWPFRLPRRACRQLCSQSVFASGTQPAGPRRDALHPLLQSVQPAPRTEPRDFHSHLGAHGVSCANRTRRYQLRSSWHRRACRWGPGW